MKRRGTNRQRSRQGGFSLVEGLVATALLLLVILGSMPLFTQSMLNNVAGREATMATNLGSDQLEQVLQMPILNEQLAFAGGNAHRIYQLFSTADADAEVVEQIVADLTETTRPTVADYRAEFLGQAWTNTPTTENWGRVIAVRQYGVAAMDDQRLDIAEQLPGGTSEIQVHLKEIEVTVFSGLPENGSLIVSGPVNTMRVLKGF